jgi:hypothetical protein
MFVVDVLRRRWAYRCGRLDIVGEGEGVDGRVGEEEGELCGGQDEVGDPEAREEGGALLELEVVESEGGDGGSVADVAFDVERSELGEVADEALDVFARGGRGVVERAE